MPTLNDVIRYILYRWLVAGLAFIGFLLLLYATIGTAPLPTIPGDRRQQVTVPTPTFAEFLTGADDTGGILNGDFGQSFAERRPAAEVIAARWTATSELLGLALLQSLIYGLVVGAAMAFLRQIRIDAFLRLPMLLAVAAPTAWLALLMLVVFAVRAGDFPMGGRCPPVLSGGCPPLAERMDYITLPLRTLVTFWTGAVALYVRDALRGVFSGEDGLSRATLLRLLARFVPQKIAFLVVGVMGSVIVAETLFSWPGIGRVTIEAGLRADYPVLLAAFFLMGLLTLQVYGVMVVVQALLSWWLGDTLPGYAITTTPVLQAARATPMQPLTGERQPVRSPLMTVLAILAAIFLLNVYGLANAPEILSPHDPADTSVTERLLLPNTEHPMGTDELGRDAFARLLYASQTTINAALATAFVALLIGGFAGILGGIMPGTAGQIINLPINVAVLLFNLVPTIVFVLLLLVVERDAPWETLQTSFTLTVGWTNAAVVFRARIHAARAGQRPLLAGLLGMSLYSLAINMIAFILLEFTVSFLGFGAQPPMASWGNLFTPAQKYLLDADYLIVIPGVFVTLVVFALVLIAARLRDGLELPEPPGESVREKPKRVDDVVVEPMW